MPRYIDADRFLKDEIKRCGCVPIVGSCTTDNESLAYQLAKAPTADVEEVKHGYVIEHQGAEDEYYCECSVCKTHEVNLGDKYCSECGAKLDGRRDK